jgi:glycosyltransferase involved in cell wall biosynthesis
MKVAFLGDRLGLATGGNWYVARVAEELAQLGVEVTLITLVPPRDIPWSSQLRVLSRPVGFSFGQKPGPGNWRNLLTSRLAAVTELRKLIREPYDILYSVGGPSNIVNYLSQKGAYPPRVSVAALFHLFRQGTLAEFLASPDTYQKPFQTFYHGLGDHLAKRFQVVTVSEFWKNKLLARGFHEKRITVIPVGADWEGWPELSTDRAKEALGLSGRFVVYTSPFRLNKGVLIVLQALHLLKEKYPFLTVMATGVTDHQTGEQAGRFVRENGLEAHFRYAGIVSRENLPMYYVAADVVVLVSLEEEGWGITLLEGMMAGKPVSGSPMGALPELVRGRGILLEKNTAQDLAQALSNLIESPELGRELSRSGASYARGFSYEAAARAHLGLFEKLINEGYIVKF